MHSSSSRSRNLFALIASALLAIFAGQAVADSYLMNPLTDFSNQGPPYPEGVYVVTSEHFCVWYGTGLWARGFGGGTPAGAAQFAGLTLSNLEACFIVYYTKLGWEQFGPCKDSSHAHYGDGNSYKASMYFLGTDLPGYGNGWAFGGGSACGNPTQWCDPGACQDDSWVVPHELSHGVVPYQGEGAYNNAIGNWHEFTGNWNTEQCLQDPIWRNNTPPMLAKATQFGRWFPLRNRMHYILGSGCHYYHSYYIWTYMYNNPDNLPYPYLGSNSVGRLWQEAILTPDGEMPFDTMKRTMPGIEYERIMAGYAAHNVNWDYWDQDLYLAQIGATTDDNEEELEATRRGRIELERCPDRAGWWRVPMGTAPQPAGYVHVPLVPSSASRPLTVTVDLKPRDYVMGDVVGAIRATIVVLSTGNYERYSTPWASGTNSIVLTDTTQTGLYLAVVATPSRTMPNSMVDFYDNKPCQRHPSKMLHSFEVSLVNAVPNERTAWRDGQAGTRHPNGGGFKANTAVVDGSAFIGTNAAVLDNARVLQNSRVEDFAVVFGNARLSNFAIVSGHALVNGNARVVDYGKVRDYAWVKGNALVAGHGKVIEFAKCENQTLLVKDYAVVKGAALAWPTVNDVYSGFGGESIGEGDLAEGIQDMTTGVRYAWSWGNNQTRYEASVWRDYMYVGYEFGMPERSLARDLVALGHAYLDGSPTWASSVERGGHYVLDGASSYVTLPSYVSDCDDMTVSAWVRNDATNINKCIFEMGNGGNKYMRLLANGGGVTGLTFLINNGVSNQQVWTLAKLPSNVWTHVAVSLLNSTGMLYMGGIAVGTNNLMTFNPEDCNAANSNASPNANYIGRNQAGNYFRGAVDSFRTYRVGHPPAMVASLYADDYDCAWYSFDQTSGTSVTDNYAQVSTNMATLPNGGTWVNDAVMGRALTLDGANQYVSMPARVGKSPDFSVAGWVYRTGGGSVLWSLSKSATVCTYLNISSGGAMQWYMGGTGVTRERDEYGLPLTMTSPAGTAVPNGTWTHVAFTMQDNTARIYLNGTPVAETNYVMLRLDELHAGNLWIGRSAAGTSYLGGTIDDFRMFDHGLGEDDVATLYKTKCRLAAVQNVAVSNVTMTNAWVQGEVIATGSAPTWVFVYYGTTDGGTTPGSWSSSTSLGVRAEGPLVANLRPLATNMTYYFRFYATNQFGNVWASPSMQFKTIALGDIDNEPGPLHIGPVWSKLRGNLLASATTTAFVSIFYGMTDGGTTRASWQNEVSLGNLPVGFFERSVSNLVANSTFYYRCMASNAYGMFWASSTMVSNTEPALGVNNDIGATSILGMNATLSGRLGSTYTNPCNLFIYWGPTDGGTTPGSWANVVNAGIRSVGSFSTNVFGMLVNTKYYYRVCGTNIYGTDWASQTTNFTTLGGLTLDNSPGATNVTATSAVLNGKLTYTATNQNWVWIYWGTTDGGSNRAAWATSNYVGLVAGGGFSTPISGLSSNTIYYYRSFGTNVYSAGWASSTEIMKTASDLSSWWYKTKIRFDGYTRSSQLNNFPALVKLGTNVPGFAYSQFFSPVGNDLRFSDQNGAELNYEIDTWTNGGFSYVWVQLLALKDTSTYIWAHWGNGAVAGGKAAYTTNGATWSEGYLGVYHMNAPNSPNSTARGYNGVGTTSLTVPGMVGNAQFFTNTSSSMNCGDLDAATSVTVMAFIKSPGDQPDATVVSKANSYQMNRVNVDYLWCNFWNASGNKQMDVGTWGWGYSWNQAAAMFDGPSGVGQVYQDGSVKRTTYFTPGPLTLNNNSLLIGGSPNYRWVDEVRVSRIARSADWTWAEWNNAKNVGTFNKFSSMATNIPPWACVNITNVNGTATVDISVTTYTLKGTNNFYTVGRIVWTNSLTGVGGGFAASPGPACTGWAFTVNLVVGDNVVTVYGTNTAGLLQTDVATIKVVPPLPYVNITNVSAIGVLPSVTSYTLKGTNTIATVGTIKWTNALTGAMGSIGAGSTGWAFNVNLATGDNVIVVSGTNTYNDYHQDSATVSVVMVALTNRSASSIGSTTARVNAWLTNTSEIVTNIVICYYGTNNGGTVKANWLTNKVVGSDMPIGVMSTVLGGLTPTTTYYYTFLTTNSVLGVWATNVMSFTTMSPGWGMRSIPRTNALLFSAMTASFPSNGYRGNWTAWWPTGIFTAMASPTVETIGGEKWINHNRLEGDGYQVGHYPYSTNVSGNVVLPCQGVSAFIAVIPTRNTIGDAWTSVIDVMMDVVRVGVRNDNGRVSVVRRGVGVDSDYYIPNRQMTILSLLIQTNGMFNVWANGSNILYAASTTTPLTNLWPATDAGFNKFINVGRNNPDGWSAFNGDIGDVFFYTNTLTDAERRQIEGDMYTNFFSSARSITRSASDIQPTTVTLNGEMLSTGIGGAPEVYACYGTVNAGFTSMTNWQNVVMVGSSIPTGMFSKGITDLTSGTMYYYTFYAINAIGETWSDDIGMFGTATAPVISNEAPYSVRVSTVRARGNLVATNFSSTTVILYHGTTDGGTTPGSWEHADNLGVMPNGRLDTIITNISGAAYFYRYYATNGVGEMWADTTMSSTPDTPYDGKANGYLRVIDITFNGYSGSKLLVDYPAMVRLNASSIAGFLYTQFKSGTNDIRFVAADGSLLSYEIDTWKPSGDSYLWVRVPVLESNTLIHMYYSKTGETAPTDRTNTWDDGFVAVWHMTNTLDKNATGNSTFDVGSTWGTAPTNATGYIGMSQDFPGGAGMNVGDLDLPDTFSLSYWAYLDDNQGDRWNIQKGNANYSLMDRYGNWEFNVNYWNFQGSWASTPSAQGAWGHIVGTYDGGYLRLYKNGVLMSSVARTGMTQNDAQMVIGNNVDGRLDEVRAERVTRPADWIGAMHLNMTGAYAFATYVVSNLAPTAPQVVITDPVGGRNVAGSTTVYRVTGTNNPNTVGSITWTNLLNGGRGTVPATGTWAFTVSLSPGYNTIEVEGTNTTEISDMDTTVIVVPSVAVTTEGASGMDTFAAMLNGTVNPNNCQSYTWFEYGTDTTYGAMTSLAGAGDGSVAIAFSNAIGSLSADTLYHYRAVASNAIWNMVVTGVDMTFQTLPLIETLPATVITKTTATLNGQVNPNGVASRAWFEWGTSTNYGNATTPTINVGGGSANVPFSSGINGLTADTVYHFRAVSSNGTTTIYGKDRAFIAGRNITQEGLYFCVLAASIPDTDGAPTGPWKQALPDDGTMFTEIGTPVVNITNGAKFVRNYDGDEGATGYRARDLSADPRIPCDGVTIIANVQPIYYPSFGGTRGEVVDIFYDRLALAVAVGDGRIMVARNYWVDYGPVIPEGEKTVLSLVVQSDGSYVAYTNGAAAMSGGANGYFTNMVPTGLEGFKKYVNVGRNNPDGWSCFNGLMGDIFVYTNALSDPDRQAVENIQAYVPPDPGDVDQFAAGRGTSYGQVQLSWSNNNVTILACTNRTYSTNSADWFNLAVGVSSPWTHNAASNYASVYYRIVSGSYTSSYDVGKFDVNIAAGSIAWLSFPFGVQLGCDALSEWFGRQLEPRYKTLWDFPSLQKQASPGGTIVNCDYYIDDEGDGSTNWYPDNTVAANAGYVLFLPENHGGVKVTGIGMVQTNNVSMLLPYNSIPWVGLAYNVNLDMRQSGLTNMLQPPRLYSSFNYDFVDSQQTPGGPIRYAEYYRDNWGAGTVDFFPSITGADRLEGGKGYLLFFSTTRGADTGTWSCARPY